MQTEATIDVSSYDAVVAERDELRGKVSLLQSDVSALVAQVKWLKSRLYGQTSERRIEFEESGQIPLFPLPEAPVESVAETTTISEHERVKRPGRKPLPADLPREQKVHEPEERECESCGRELERIGEDVTEELEYLPASFNVIEHIRVKRACPCCKNGVFQGKLPPGAQVFEKARPGPGLIAHVLTSKYCDHIPLARQEQMFARHGVSLPRQRLCDWTGAAVEQILLIIALQLR